MLTTGISLLSVGIVLQSLLLPAQRSLSGDPTSGARIFQQGAGWGCLYLLVEPILRWGGAILIAGSIVGFQASLGTVILGGFIAGALANIVAPILSLAIAALIYPWLRKQNP